MQSSIATSVSSSTVWFVAHARPRCEKKVAQYCSDLSIAVTLPCYQSTHRYQRKTVTFEKPIFPGYVFLRAEPEQKAVIWQSDYVANVLAVFDQQLFQQQLETVLLALDSGLEIQLAPEIGKGKRVRIKSGPLGGMEGWVEERYGFDTVLLRIDFIGQAAAVKFNAGELELI
jgi:transcriptional antiterminator RfaH